MATTQRMLKSTAIPTKTVEARKAGLKMEEKLTKLPMHWMSGLENNSESPPEAVEDLQPTGNLYFAQLFWCTQVHTQVKILLK